jgi:cytochrome oxidase Cu insertion factor (SCO1/SenC/PrrC family)
MNSTSGSVRLSKVMEIVIWLAGLGVLAANVLLLRQNRSLQDTLAPQITSGAQFERLAGLTLDGRLQPIALPSEDSKVLIITFSPACPACQANQEGWTNLAGALEQKGVRVLWVSRDPVEITKDYCVKHGIRLSDALADPPHRTYVRLDEAGWDSIFAYFGERSPARVEVGARTTGCGSELSQTSAKSCK